jgi:hypothetical protein
MNHRTAAPTLSRVIDALDQHYANGGEADAHLAAWMQHIFSPACVLGVVEEVLASPNLLAEVAARSYHHGNGFLKVVLAARHGWKLRLHIWFPGAPCEENIHDHRWSFASTVLCGELLSETFVDNPAGTVSGVAYQYHARNTGQDSHKIAMGGFRLHSQGQTLRRAGEAYSLPSSVLHRICDYPGKGLVATMMCSAPTRETTNRLLVSADHAGIDPNVEQNPLTPHQLACLLGRFTCAYAAGLWPMAA